MPRKHKAKVAPCPACGSPNTRCTYDVATDLYFCTCGDCGAAGMRCQGERQAKGTWRQGINAEMPVIH